ncbi:MAG: hypothetical protein R6U66_09680 [Bacteroidales bacterium]
MRKMGIFLLSAFLLISCEKEDFTKPVSVDFAFGLSETELDLEKSTMTPALSMDTGIWLLESIDFEGRREQGGDYFFTYTPTEPLEIVFEKEHWKGQLSFDIPQGVYQRIEVTFHLVAEAKHPSFRLRGNISDKHAFKEPFVFAYEAQETIKLIARNGEGGQAVTVRQGQPIEAKVTIQTNRMFDLLPPGLLKNATRSERMGEQMIFVSRRSNAEIFQLMATRILNSTEVLFE